MKITIEELAKKAGVSISTVSNVLNNKGKVSDAKRNEITKIANEMGYIFTKRKKEKKTSKKGKIGIIFPSHSSETNMNYYISEVLLGVEEAINETGYSLLIKSFRNTDDFHQSLLEQSLDGILLIGGLFPEQFLITISDLGCPVLTIGTYTLRKIMHSVVADNQMGAFQATSHLLQLGHKKIGFINGPNTTNTSRSKLQGFKEALLSNAVNPEMAWVINSDFSLESSYEAAKHYLKLKDRPTALFVGDDRIAMGAIKAFQEEGISVPDDVAIVGYGNSSSGNYITPSLTTINVFQKRQGKMGAVRLMDLIENRREGISQSEIYRLVYPTELIIRDSCGYINTRDDSAIIRKITMI